MEMAGCDSAGANSTQNKVSSPAFQRDYSQVNRPLEGYIPEKLDLTSLCVSALFILTLLG